MKKLNAVTTLSNTQVATLQPNKKLNTSAAVDKIAYDFKVENELIIAILEYGNATLFNNKLPKFVITYDEDMTHYGAISYMPYYHDNTLKYFKLFINHTLMRTNEGLKQVVITTLHEAIHAYCRVMGIKEVSNRGRYHNGNFKKEAERIGLITSQDRTIGCRTPGIKEERLQDFFKHLVTKGFDLNALENAFTLKLLNQFSSADTEKDGGNEGNDGDTSKPEKKDYNLKVWHCPNCGQKTRAAKSANLICGTCYDTLDEIIKLVPKQ